MGNTVFPFEAVAPATPEERLLLRRYPLFFRAAYFPGTHPSNLGLWGIECGPGWHPLIEQAASIIEADLHKLLRRLTNVQMLTSVERRLQYIPILAHLLVQVVPFHPRIELMQQDRKSTRLNSSH